MSITKKLREWLKENNCRLYDSMTADLRRIADRIDAAHEEDVRKAYDVGFASADDWYADKTDEELAEHGLVRLPVDAAGRTWHVGDLYTLRTDRSHNVERLEWMEWDGDCWQLDGEDVGGTTVTVASRLAAIADELEADDE